MGNCQAIDNATLLIQHPGGRVDKHYWPLPASEIMNTNPGHYVALLLTTTTLNTAAAATTTTIDNKNNNTDIPVRITRIKLLKPTDTLALGHVYRLITTQEVMKGLWAKKHSRMKQQRQTSLSVPVKMQEKVQEKSSSVSNRGVGRSEVHKNQVKHERHRSGISAAGRGTAWQPSLLSISEAGSS